MSGVILVGAINGGLPPVYNPLEKVRPFHEQLEILRKLLTQAGVLALVTFMLTISVAKSYAEKKRYVLFLVAIAVQHFRNFP